MESQERRYLIEGGKPLEGSIEVLGAKNAITKQLVVSLLTSQPCTFTNVPNITEIKTVLEMLGQVGMAHEWVDRQTLQVQTKQMIGHTISNDMGKYNRIPVLLMGPLLHRTGNASVPIMGGCKIGSRPVDMHIKSLRELGAQILVTKDSYIAKARRLLGTNITLDYPSVGATENIIISAVLAGGITVIHNAAVEPEIIDTILFLQKMGAHIMIDGDRKIIIEGVDHLGGARHHTITDRIEVASFAIAAVATNGNIMINNARQKDMVTFFNYLLKVGGMFSVYGNGICFGRSKELSPIYVETDVHPGFMTDWQQPFTVLLTQANGVSIVHETVYEKRFDYAESLNQMGADIELSPGCLGRKPCRFRDLDYKHSCIVRGPKKLHSSKIKIPDLRAGFAHIIAALLAEGTSEISGVSHIERGYADVVEKLRAIGASIKVI